MGARCFEELAVWQLSVELKREVYRLIATGRVARDFEFCTQIRESAASAPAQIAEGFGRYRPREFAKYMRFAKGELNETHNHLIDGIDRGLLSEAQCDAAFKLANRAIRASTRLINYLESRREPPPPEREP
jgi:four helix bundle protein